ncbi:MAG: DUF5320 domain-containing protein [Mollicutes bacterium]|nr:DUF5320 domain-containing protein [Mollicutes bacterium]
MPKKDGMGPTGKGPATGRGLGNCTDNGQQNDVGTGMGLGLGFGCRRGGRRCFRMNQVSSKTKKEILKEQKDILQDELEAVDKQLENLKD